MTVDSLPVRSHLAYIMEQGKQAVRAVLEEVPVSIRALAREAGVSESLLRAIRDGNRRLTAETRKAVVAALRRLGERHHTLADRLEAADSSPEPGGDDG